MAVSTLSHRRVDADAPRLTRERRSLPDGDLPIRLGLYYPLLPKLVQWQSVAEA